MDGHGRAAPGSNRDQDVFTRSQRRPPQWLAQPPRWRHRFSVAPLQDDLRRIARSSPRSVVNPHYESSLSRNPALNRQRLDRDLETTQRMLDRNPPFRRSADRSGYGRAPNL